MSYCFRSTPGHLRAVTLVAAFAVAACGSGDAPVFEDDHTHVGPDGLGVVSLETSCSEAAQPVFDRAVAMLHSFWLQEAYETFDEASEIDPDCAMAYWGKAMVLWGNPMTRAAPSDGNAAQALEHIEEARARAGDISHREHMYIEAAAVLFEGHPELHHFDRMRAHEEAMRELSEAHPEDPEAATFYGRIVVGNAPPDDLTFSRQLHAASVMEPLFLENPDHPGLAHYLIHAFDAPAIAEEGLEAAFRYADIAPDAPHALHMPTHIFTRMGYWEESIRLNARSAQAEPDPDAAVHPMDYMVYAHLQLGQDGEAGEIADRARDIPDEFYGGLLGYNFAAMQARYPLERNRWEEAAEVPIAAGALPYVEAVSRFARAVGAARAGMIDRAEEEIDALASLVARTREMGDDYWEVVAEAQRLAAVSWVERARGNDGEALRLAREAADLEGTVEKHPVTPGPLLPARELLADLLLELDRAEEALEAYERTLETDPNRARALFGAARAAEAAGMDDVAAGHYATLLELLENADPDRPDLLAARDWRERM